MNQLIAIFSFIFTLTLIIITHELGHYIVARLFHVPVLCFSIGFGKPFYTFRDRNGTEWKFSFLFFGGYVKFSDESNQTNAISSNRQFITFNQQSLARRFAVVAAGPIANFALGIIFFTLVFLSGVNEIPPIVARPPADTPAAIAGLKAGDEILSICNGVRCEFINTWSDLIKCMVTFDKHMHAKVGLPFSVNLTIRRNGKILNRQLNFSNYFYKSEKISKGNFASTSLDMIGFLPLPVSVQIENLNSNGPAAMAGMLPGDKIFLLQGKTITSVEQFNLMIRTLASKTLDVDVFRNGKILHLNVAPLIDQNGIAKIDVQLSEKFQNIKLKYGFLQALKHSIQKTLNITQFSAESLFYSFTGKTNLNDLSGPIAIAIEAGKSASVDISTFLSFVGFVSVSIGVLNLLPIPALDGGHLLYYSIEAMIGKPLSKRIETFLQICGIFFIIILSTIALSNDLKHIFRSLHS